MKPKDRLIIALLGLALVLSVAGLFVDGKEVRGFFARLCGCSKGAATVGAVDGDRTFAPIIWAQLAPDAWLDGSDWKAGQGAAPGVFALIARAIVPVARTCPRMTIGGEGETVTMRRREPIYPSVFPLALCEAVYDGRRLARLDGRALPRRGSDIRRILVIGDTGCRVTYYTSQDCRHEDGEDGWPFRQVSRAAAEEPDIDLIVHVGDYHYRERPCPAGTARRCGKQRGGYNWSSWRADFFRPAERLLAKAPWVFVRGNHENCARAGAGWTSFFWPFLDSVPEDVCADHHAPYVVTLADRLSLAVLDIANSEDTRVYGVAGVEDRATLYAGWMARLAAAAVPGALWVTMQQPPWQWPAAGAASQETTAGVRDRATVSPMQYGLAALPRDAAADAAALVLSGDTHVFEMLGPAAGSKLPWVLVSGMGGTRLDRQKDFKPGLDEAGAPLKLRYCSVAVASDKTRRGVDCESPAGKARGFESRTEALEAFAWFGFGYTVLERRGGKPWTATVHDRSGKPVYVCTLASPPEGGCKVKT